jgi:hypothetical protein
MKARIRSWEGRPRGGWPGDGSAFEDYGLELVRYPGLRLRQMQRLGVDHLLGVR